MSTMPTTTGGPRSICRVVSHMWLMAHMRQPGWAIYSDFAEDTWPISSKSSCPLTTSFSNVRSAAFRWWSLMWL